MTEFLPAGTHIWVPALVMFVGLLGIVIPILPGLFLVLMGVLLWAWHVGTTGSWVVFGICAVLFVLGTVGKYAIPGKRLKADSVGTGSLVIAVMCGIAGMFVIPIVGFFVGFILGLFVLAYLPRRDATAAWSRTKTALKAIATSIGIELVAGILIVLTWVVGVLVT